MSERIDLEGLERLYQAATPGPLTAWKSNSELGEFSHPATMVRRYVDPKGCRSTSFVAVFNGADLPNDANIECAVQLHNSWPALRDEIRELRAENERLRIQGRTHSDESWRRKVSSLESENERLRAVERAALDFFTQWDVYFEIDWEGEGPTGNAMSLLRAALQSPKEPK